MKKLMAGIVNFRQTITPEYKRNYTQLTLGQTPDALFIACSDSRVAPNVFASTDPGDLFVIRNVGNMVPRADRDGISTGDFSEAAAIEFALMQLKVHDIIICGHSECGAMQAICGGHAQELPPHLRQWLGNGMPAFEKLNSGAAPDKSLARHNCLSQLNVLEQMEHLKTYKIVRDRMEAGQLQLHGFWFDIGNFEVQKYDAKAHRFVAIDESHL